MLTVNFTVTTPPSAAFDYMVTDYFAHHPLWDPGVVATEPLDEGPMRPGLRGEETRRFLGSRTTRFTVVAVEPGQRLVLRDEPGVWELTRIYEFTPDQRGTAVTFHFDMTPRARWFRLLHPAVRPLIDRQVRTNMERLRQHLSQ